MTDELKAEREAFEKWFTMEFIDLSPKGYLASHMREAWQARARLDRTHTTEEDEGE